MNEKTKLSELRRNARLLGRFLRGSTVWFVVCILATALTVLADMLSPQIIRMAIDNAIGGQPAEYAPWVMALVNACGGFVWLGQHLWVMALAILAVALLKVVGQYVTRVSNTRGSERLVKTMRDMLFSHIERLPFTWHRKNRTGDIIQRCTSDIDTMKNFISEQLTSLFRVVTLLILSVTFMVPMNGWLTLIALIPMPVIMGYSFRFHHHIGEGFRECDENEGKLSAMAQENLTGVRVVRAFGRERYERDRFEQHNAYYTKLWVRLAKVMSRFWSTADILSGLQVMLVVVFGTVFCLRGEMLPGEYVAFISYNAMLVWPVRMLGRMISEMSKAGVSIERVRYIMESEEEPDDPDALCPPMDGDIRFEHVRYQYEGYPPILHDIDFTMKAGTTLGILGGTGSGKSTMMLLLDRMYDLPPDGGRITIGGVDIRDIRLSYLRRHIGIVLQEPFLFSRTIAENIGITQETLDMEAVRAAARAACLDETVESFSKGYDTFVGERGVTLSGGQKQRAAIARMLTQNTPILVFDDSLSAVDTETDAKIRQSLEARFGSASILLISHRITTLSKADWILVLEHGKIAEQGTHEQLKQAGGLYQKIYEIQSSAEEEIG